MIIIIKPTYKSTKSTKIFKKAILFYLIIELVWETPNELTCARIIVQMLDTTDAIREWLPPHHIINIISL